MPGRPPIDEERLIEAALKEFTSKGFQEASVNAIIRDAGISKGSFYYRFRTKYELYLHLLRTGLEMKWNYIRAQPQRSQSAGSAPGAPERPGNRRADIFDGFLAQAVIGTRFAEEYPLYYRLSEMFTREKGAPVYADAIRDLGHNDASGLESQIRAAMRRGEIRGDLSERLVIAVITHMLSVFDQLLFADTEWDLDEANELLVQYVEALRSGFGSRQTV